MPQKPGGPRANGGVSGREGARRWHPGTAPPASDHHASRTAPPGNWHPQKSCLPAAEFDEEFHGPDAGFIAFIRTGYRPKLTGEALKRCAPGTTGGLARNFGGTARLGFHGLENSSSQSPMQDVTLSPARRAGTTITGNTLNVGKGRERPFIPLRSPCSRRAGRAPDAARGPDR